MHGSLSSVRVNVIERRLIATAKIAGNRMHLLIKSIEVDRHIMVVKLSAYDTDGQEGVYIPGSEDINALKEVGANIGGSMGTSFIFASSAKDQIISEAARGLTRPCILSSLLPFVM